MKSIYIENENVILENEKGVGSIWKIQKDGSVQKTEDSILTMPKTYKPLDIFYTHSGSEEMVKYFTVSSEGTPLLINIFVSLIKNVGIKRYDGQTG